MTDARAHLAELLGNRHTLLLDFDGPICSVFAGLPAPTVAADLREKLFLEFGPSVKIPEGSDPLKLLREFAVDVHPTRVRFAENVLRQMELVAVGTARATPGAAQLVLGALGAGRQVAVVSNNSDASVEKYLDQENLRSNFTFVSARYSAMDPALLKPDPHLLHRALDWLNTAPSDAVIVGDSIADIEAGRVAGVMTIGFSTRQAKRDDLLEAGADAVCDDLFRIVDALAPKPEDRT